MPWIWPSRFRRAGFLVSYGKVKHPPPYLKLATPKNNTKPTDIYIYLGYLTQSHNEMTNEKYFQIVLVHFADFSGEGGKMAGEVPDFKTDSTGAIFGFEQVSTFI